MFSFIIVIYGFYLVAFPLVKIMPMPRLVILTPFRGTCVSVFAQFLSFNELYPAMSASWLYVTFCENKT